MQIEEIQNAMINTVPIEYTVHCQKRMLERNISRADILNCIQNGEIIEDYPLDQNNHSERSFPACLISGNKPLSNTVIHVVVGFNGQKIIIISACYPDKIHWHADFKTRRK